MKLATWALPTRWAAIMAEEVGLYMSCNGLKSIDLREALIEFQQMSLFDGSDFESCLVAYQGMGIDLSDKQIETLKIIHKNTPKMLVGIVLQQLLEVRNDGVTPDPHERYIALKKALAILKSDTRSMYSAIGV